ncbi:MAG: ribonuclease HII [bacterium]
MAAGAGRISAAMSYEAKLKRGGYKYIAGVDEAGRGPIAGPVVAAAVILPFNNKITGIKDSKKLSDDMRRCLYSEIIQTAFAYAIGIVDEDLIDHYNILRATKNAMQQAVFRLKMSPEYILVDGNFLIPKLKVEQKAIVRGDDKEQCISAASIIAKVTRDDIMLEYDKKYPEYGFGKHKGYGTKYHFKMLEKYGPSPIHRKSFRPVSQLKLFNVKA